MSDATKPALPHPDKPRRRWLKFTAVTTLLVVLAMAGIWVGWNAQVIRERRAMKQWLISHDGDAEVATDGTVTIPFWREWMGDEPIATIIPSPDLSSQQDVERLQAVFPEAQLMFFDKANP